MFEFSIENKGEILDALKKINDNEKQKKNAQFDIMQDKDFTDFISTLDAAGFTEVFDYDEWMLKNGIDFENTGDVQNLFIKAGTDLTGIRRLVTAAVRFERFGSGLLNELYRNGFFSLMADKLNVL